MSLRFITGNKRHCFLTAKNKIGYKYNIALFNLFTSGCASRGHLKCGSYFSLREKEGEGTVP